MKKLKQIQNYYELYTNPIRINIRTSKVWKFSNPDVFKSYVPESQEDINRQEVSFKTFHNTLLARPKFAK